VGQRGVGLPRESGESVTFYYRRLSKGVINLAARQLACLPVSRKTAPHTPRAPRETKHRTDTAPHRTARTAPRPVDQVYS